MRRLRLLLVSAVLMVGCAADDSLGGNVPASTEASETEATGGTDAPTETAPETTAAPATDTTGGPAPATVSTTAPPTEATDATGTSVPAGDAATPTSTTVETIGPATTADPADSDIDDAATPTSTAAAPTTTETTTTEAPTTTETPTTTAAPTTTVPVPAVDGAVVFYEATCDSCHGADGRGGSGADLSESTMDLDAVIEVVRFGVADTEMEGWDFEPKPPGLTREEIEAVAAYVMTLRTG